MHATMYFNVNSTITLSKTRFTVFTCCESEGRSSPETKAATLSKSIQLEGCVSFTVRQVAF